MDVYITFYDTPQEDTISIANGFSFGREGMGDYVDLFFRHDAEQAEIEIGIERVAAERGGVDRIFCSVFYYALLKNLRPLLDDRWILGGPAITGLVHRNVKLPCKLVGVPIEEFAGKEELSSRFDPYFIDFVKNIRGKGFPLKWLNFSCGIGSGCYWNKCKFCDHKLYNNFYVRPDIKGILEQVPADDSYDSRAYLCFSALTPAVLDEILCSKKKKNVILASFIRADRRMIETLQKYDKGSEVCKGVGFGIGLEALSQSLVDRLNKGIKIDNVIQLARLFLERGGYVSLSLMDHYACMTSEMVDESKATLTKLKKVLQQFPYDRSSIRMGGITVWSNRKVAEEMSNGFEIEAFSVHGFFERYKIPIPENSPAWNYNRQVSLAIKESGIRLASSSNKIPFLSLKNS